MLQILSVVNAYNGMCIMLEWADGPSAGPWLAVKHVANGYGPRCYDRFHPFKKQRNSAYDVKFWSIEYHGYDQLAS
jgi:hypothetical protein